MIKAISILMALTITCSKASADMDLFCNSLNNMCREKIEASITALGCMVDNIDCTTNAEGEYCKVESQNCSEPASDLLFGLTADAPDCRSGLKTKLSDIDLTLTWTFGFFRSYVRNICVK